MLLTNLANRTQPILRYDLGDAVQVRPDPCPCGDRLPAIQVQGRTADLLTFPTRSGEPVTIAPLAISLALERLPGIELVQIVHTAPTNLGIRLQPTCPAPSPSASGKPCTPRSPGCPPPTNSTTSP